MADHPLSRASSRAVTVLFCISALLLPVLQSAPVRAQAAGNVQQRLVFARLRASYGTGAITAMKTDRTGNVYLLMNSGDGVRLLKTDAGAANVLGEAQLGAKGDTGLALALDDADNVYATGTSTSGQLAGTSGAAFPAVADASTNSFLAKWDSTLTLRFLTFTGGSKMAVSALSVTSDAAFVTGTIYSATLPVTDNGIQQSPAPGSFGNGFVERFSTDGTSLVYATYLSGANGDTHPSAIAVDAGDDAFIAGGTSASGFPTVAALVPRLGSSSSAAGFLTGLTPLGDDFTFSTFIPGGGLSALALDVAGANLLATGLVDFGQFPVDTVAAPLAGTGYQVLLRIPLDGSNVGSSVALAPATASSLATAADGSVWAGGTLSAPLLPFRALAGLGDGFALRVSPANKIDQTARFGGVAVNNSAFAQLPISLPALAVDAGGTLLVAGSVAPTASASLLTTERFDLPLSGGVTAAFPSSLADGEQTSATCAGSLCAGSSAYLAELDTGSGTPALSLSADDLPFVTVRNLGSSIASGLALTVSTGSLTSSCPSELAPGGECSVRLRGGAAGTLTATLTGAPAATVSFPAYASDASASALTVSPRVLDFGIVTVQGSAPRPRTLTVTNLGSAAESFTSAAGLLTGSPATVRELANDCPAAGATLKQLGPGQTCHITLGFAPGSAPGQDGLTTGTWLIGSDETRLSGWAQAAAVALSSPAIDFGTQFAGGPSLPRYLYLSNNSDQSVPHAAVTLDAGSPFTVTDACPQSLAPGSVCGIRIVYLAANAPSSDAAALTLDGGTIVQITGLTLPQPGTTGSTVNPDLSVVPGAVAFPTATLVTGVSAETESVTVTNTGAADFPLTLGLTGDFTDQTSCGDVLPAGTSCAVALRFVPGAPGLRTGLLSVTAGAGTSPAYVTLSGNGIALLPAANGVIDLGDVPVGEPKTLFLPIAQPVALLHAKATEAFRLVLVEDAGFGPGQPPSSAFGSMLSQSCHICLLGIRFTPSAAGPQAGQLTLSTANGGGVFTLKLTGNGVSIGGLLLTPSNHDFGATPLGSSSGSVLFTATNLLPGGQPVALGVPVLTGDFSLLDPGAGELPAGSLACGGMLAPGTSCFFAVAFVPTAAGQRSGTATLGGVSATLTGTGTPNSGLTLNPGALTFQSGGPPTQTIALGNLGSSTLTVGTPTTTLRNFTATSGCTTLAPGASCTITIAFAPGTVQANDTLSVPITPIDPAGGFTATNVAAVPLAGSFTAQSAGLVISPEQAAYGPAAVGFEGLTRQFTVANTTGKTLALSLNVPREFVLAGPPCLTLAPGASCPVALTFLPLDGGDAPGTLAVTGVPDDGSRALTTRAYPEGFGEGSRTLTMTGDLLVGGVANFGSIAPGQTATQQFTISNPSRTDPLTVRRVVSEPPFFSSSTCGASLAPAQACTVMILYAPAGTPGTGSGASLTDVGALTIESDAASSPDVINLTGQASSGGSASGSATPLTGFTLTTSSLVFPPVAVGEPSPAQMVTLLNTGTVPIHLGALSAPSDFTVGPGCGTVGPGASCTLSVKSTPKSAGQHVGSLEIASDAGASLEFISLLSNGGTPALDVAPASLNFGTLSVGQSSTLTVEVTNNGSTPVTFAGVSASSPYTVAPGDCPAAGQLLAANASCTLPVIFAPTVSGTFTGTFTLTSSASTLPRSVALIGVGVQSQLTANPGSLAFGPISVGAQANLTLTLTNGGSAPVTGLSFMTTGDYTVVQPCPLLILAPGASCTVGIQFSPQAIGQRTGVLTISHSDASPPLAIPLTGAGVFGGGFTLTVHGASSAAVTVRSGAPAAFHLLLTPLDGFVGAVALTCTPISPAPFGSCSLLPATLQLGAGGVQTSVATLNTITSVGGNASNLAPDRPGEAHHDLTLEPVIACLLGPGLLSLWLARKRLRRRLPVLLAFLFAVAVLTATGCGSGGDPNVRYTPAGNYRYQVTATSTSGAQTTQTVTLNLTVTAR